MHCVRCNCIVDVLNRKKAALVFPSIMLNFGRSNVWYLTTSTTAAQDESTKGLQQPSDIDDTSDYFADVETSSCGSSDHDIVWTNMSDNKAAWKCPRGSPILQGSLDKQFAFQGCHLGPGASDFHNSQGY